MFSVYIYDKTFDGLLTAVFDAYFRNPEIAQKLLSQLLPSAEGKAEPSKRRPRVREALQGLQLAFRRAPGLVADGRDMGTVVFQGATLKVYLTASAAQRAERRHKQLIGKGISANIDSLRADLEMRDERDKNRAVAPLKPAEDALLLDNSNLTVEESVAQVLAWWQQRRPFSEPPPVAVRSQAR